MAARPKTQTTPVFVRSANSPYAQHPLSFASQYQIVLGHFLRKLKNLASFTRRDCRIVRIGREEPFSYPIFNRDLLLANESG
jgi:hypothetical protein